MESEEAWEISYNELQRRLEGQRDEITEYRRQASFILRSIIAAAGLVITALSLSFSVPMVRLSLGNLQQITLSDLATSFNIGTTESLVLTFAFYTIFTISSLVAVYSLLFRLPAVAFMVARPTETRVGIPSYEARRIYEVRDTTNEDIINSYWKALSDNQQTIDTLRTKLDDCYESARDGIIYGAVSSISFVLFFRPNVVFVFLLSSIGAAFILVDLQTRAPTGKYRKYMDYFWGPDTTLIVWTISAILLKYHSETYGALGIVISLIPTAYFAHVEDFDKFLDAWKRQGGITAIFIYLALTLAQLTSSEPATGASFYGAIVLFIGSIMILITLIVGRIVSKIFTVAQKTVGKFSSLGPVVADRFPRLFGR